MTNATRPPIGVLLMAYGGPNSLDDLPGYLADIRGGRTTPRAVLTEITHNYRQIGGKSPLLEITRRQSAGVERLLNGQPANAPTNYKVYLGMRHWSPWIEDTVRTMIEDGIGQAIAVAMAPHYSNMSVARYHKKVESGLQMYEGAIDFTYVDSYHDAPLYIRALSNRVQEGIARWPEGERDSVHVILSAHSLPERIVKMGDPYPIQLLETARLVASAAKLRDDQWSWSYQSAGRSGEAWLGPQIQDHIPALAAQGIRNMVSVPIGFVCDHVEILYDIDILAQSVAREHGVRLERPPALNDDPLYLKTIADLVQARTADWIAQREHPDFAWPLPDPGSTKGRTFVTSNQ